jgi:hypothetical protein
MLGKQMSGSARVSRAGFGVSLKLSLKKSANPGRVESLAVAAHPLQRQHAGRIPYPERICGQNEKAGCRFVESSSGI